MLGLAWDPDGRLWASEIGQNTWDELNLIEPGGNYGWPDCEGACGDPQYVEPMATWSPAEASPSGLAYAQDTLWMAALRGERRWGIPIAGGEADGDPVAFFTGEYGRLRAIEPAPDSPGGRRLGRRFFNYGSWSDQHWAREMFRNRPTTRPAGHGGVGCRFRSR